MQPYEHTCGMKSVFVNRLNLKLDIDDLIDTHIDYLKDTYPELDEKREDVKKILKLESARYEDSKVHMKKKAEKK